MDRYKAITVSDGLERIIRIFSYLFEVFYFTCNFAPKFTTSRQRNVEILASALDQVAGQEYLRPIPKYVLT